MAPGNIQFSNKWYLFYRLLEINKTALYSFLYFLLILSNSGCSGPQEKKANKNIPPVPVYNAGYIFPVEIIKALQQKYPGIKPIRRTDYAPLFWDFYDAKTLPFSVTTDINNDEKNDFGYLVMDHNLLRVALAISDGQQYRYWLSPFALNPRNNQGIDFCIEVKPAGRSDVIKPITQSLLLSKNGFLIKKLEQDNIIIYENEGEIALFNMK